MAFGDEREKVCAFVNIDIEAVGNWAEKRNLPYARLRRPGAEARGARARCASASRRSTPTSPRDERLAGSQISRFLVLHKELDADDGELTRTRKVRRGFIGEHYARAGRRALRRQDASSTSRPQVKFEDGRTGMVAATLQIVDAQTFAARVAARAA